MAMHEQMRTRRWFGTKAAAEGEDRFDIPTIGSYLIRRFVDHVVEAQFEALVLAERPEHGQFRRAGIEYRQNVAYADIAVVAEFVNTANGDLERYDVA